MRNVAFTKAAFAEYNELFETDLQIISRIKELIRDIDRDPFKGIGKPEPPLLIEAIGHSGWTRNHFHRG